MKLYHLLFWSLLSPDEKALVKQDWKQFKQSCVAQLIADDPYQFEHYTVDQLVRAMENSDYEMLRIEARKRIDTEPMTEEDFLKLMRVLDPDFEPRFRHRVRQ